MNSRVPCSITLRHVTFGGCRASSKEDTVSTVSRGQRNFLSQSREKYLYEVSDFSYTLRGVRSGVARGNALVQSLFAGPMVLIKDPLQSRPKVVEPLKVAQEILQVYCRSQSHTFETDVVTQDPLSWVSCTSRR